MGCLAACGCFPGGAGFGDFGVLGDDISAGASVCVDFGDRICVTVRESRCSGFSAGVDGILCEVSILGARAVESGWFSAMFGVSCREMSVSDGLPEGFGSAVSGSILGGFRLAETIYGCGLLEKQHVRKKMNLVCPTDI